MKQRILITDDDKMLLAAYRTLLARVAGLDVDFAETPKQAHELIEAHTYDGAMFDIELSDAQENGFDLLQVMKRANPTTPVLMMSSLDDDKTQARCRALGANRFASKKVDFLAQFTHQVHELLEPVTH